MQIGTQNASQINNIETLNGGFSISGNTFNLTLEMERVKKEVVADIEKLSEEISSSNTLSQEQIQILKNAEIELKDEISHGGNFLEKFQNYGKLLKSYANEMSGLKDYLSTLVKIGSGIGSLLTIVL